AALRVLPKTAPLTSAKPNFLSFARFFTEPAPLFRFRFFRLGRRFGGFLSFCSRLLFFGCRCLWFCAFCLRFSVFTLRLLLFRRFFLNQVCHVNPFDECHRSGITLALAKFHDACVSAIAFRRSWRDILKQFLDSLLLAQRRQSGATSMDRSILSERNHSF